MAHQMSLVHLLSSELQAICLPLRQHWYSDEVSDEQHVLTSGEVTGLS